MRLNIFSVLILLFWISGCDMPEIQSKMISLNGKWEITRTDSITIFPEKFESIVPVPGLVDMSKPALDTSRSFNSGIYWYKTNFRLNEEYPDLVQLKIGKVKYHAWVYLNKKLVGEHVYCFTPGMFDISKYLKNKGEDNELIIAVGNYYQMPDTVITGFDFEKIMYIPGLYDDVKLFMNNYPFIKSVQIVPLIKQNKVRVVAEIDQNGEKKPLKLKYLVKELLSKKVVSKGTTNSTDFNIEIPDCKLWTPESPFLYELTLSTGADNRKVRFGMRSFCFDKENGQALLNDKPYFIRGTTICISRFFEDSERGGLPWNDKWIIKLHEQFKDMHWNSFRNFGGLPPERWYDIADSLGFLIQNEYPIWASFKTTYSGVTSENIANEYRSWLPEHWNHPSVVIWDAQNESITDLTGEAISMVREMDLSNRPWENGWMLPQSESDPIGSHQYWFKQYWKEGKPSSRGALFDLLDSVRVPRATVNDRYPSKKWERYDNPIIMDEYGWLWLNRDGSTTPLSDRVYDAVFGENITKEERITHYCRYLGMLTEYHRAQQLCAGLLHIGALGYSRPEEPRGETSDNFIDVENVTFEPEFVKYVKPAFSPVGLMIDFWDNSIKSKRGGKVFKVYLINDLDTTWTGELKMSIQKNNNIIYHKKKTVGCCSNGRSIVTFILDLPKEQRDYQLVAEIDFNGEKVRSIRDFVLK